MSRVSFRTGDEVLHKPSGEKWLVAWADDREVICCGWPESFARASDCELIRAANDEEHWRLVEEIARWAVGIRSYRCFDLMEARRSSECTAMMHL